MIRARLLQLWPNLSHYFGIKPWEVGRLTVPELNEYQRWIKELADQQRDLARKQSRGISARRR